VLYPQLTEVCAALRDVFDARTCICAVVVGDGSELLFVAGDGQGAQELLGARLALGEGLAGYVAMAGHPIAVFDVPADERFAAHLAEQAGYRPGTFLGAPLTGPGGELIGIINVTDPSAEVVAAAEISTGGLLAVLMVAAAEVARVAAEQIAATPARGPMRVVPQPPDSV
jgi:signal transduction protein with GAF and PtsI domain